MPGSRLAFAAATGGFVAAAILACDPYWSVKGTITLGDGVDPTRYSTLRLHAGPPAHHALAFAVDGGLVMMGTTASGFPLSYELGSHIGTLPEPEVLVTATMVANADAGTAASGDATGSAVGLLPRCDLMLMGFCGEAHAPPLQLDLIP